ncbi:hypothetical protein BDR05DRAFT_1006021 [Suillus weaverae]|nr:hypothetical protein BDR05DRAFT_1006021 [Suillus weaverae]
MGDNQPSSSDKTTMTQRPRSGTIVLGASPPPPAPAPTPPSPVQEEANQFNYQATVNELTIQFLREHEQTRVAALKWLIMLHQKAPKVCLNPSGGCTNRGDCQILAIDDGTFPALLKTLSDSSEEVIKHDLQLLTQISTSSEKSYFKVFMMNLLELFSTDKKLLEARGKILEKEEDLEFASEIVQKLNMILITWPELAEFRKRLKSFETRAAASRAPKAAPELETDILPPYVLTKWNLSSAGQVKRLRLTVTSSSPTGTALDALSIFQHSFSILQNSFSILQNSFTILQKSLSVPQKSLRSISQNSLAVLQRFVSHHGQRECAQCHLRRELESDIPSTLL